MLCAARGPGDGGPVCLVYLAGAGRIGKGVRVAELPSGTVTFLFSDLEVSTRLWEQHHDAMIEARARYFDLVDGAVETCGGVVFSHAGDGVAAVFTSAPDALARSCRRDSVR